MTPADPTSAGLRIANDTPSPTITNTLIVGGTNAKYFVTGAIVSPTTIRTSTVTKSNASTWSLLGLAGWVRRRQIAKA